MNNIRSRGAVVNYLSNFVAIVPQYDFFDSDNKYCYNKKVYAVETISVSSGKTFKVANTGTNKELYTVDCCNTGDAIVSKGSGFYCKNFKIEKLSTSEGGECTTTKLCPVIGYQVSGNKQVVSQECVNNICQSIFKIVECSNAFDCPNGYCDIDSSNPSNNKCISFTPQDYCGNGICEASYNENENTCYKDCKVSIKNDLSTLYIIAAFLFALMIIIAISVYRKRK
jgi:hypothetical protein